MEGKNKQKKPIYEDDIQCKHCGKRLHIRIERETIEPAVPAQTRLNIFIDKAIQKTLKETS